MESQIRATRQTRKAKNLRAAIRSSALSSGRTRVQVKDNQRDETADGVEDDIGGERDENGEERDGGRD